MRWIKGAANQLEQRGFPGPVMADNSNGLALFNREINVPERPKLAIILSGSTTKQAG